MGNLTLFRFIAAELAISGRLYVFNTEGAPCWRGMVFRRTQLRFPHRKTRMVRKNERPLLYFFNLISERYIVSCYWDTEF